MSCEKLTCSGVNSSGVHVALVETNVYSNSKNALMRLWALWDNCGFERIGNSRQNSIFHLIYQLCSKKCNGERGGVRAWLPVILSSRLLSDPEHDFQRKSSTGIFIGLMRRNWVGRGLKCKTVKDDSFHRKTKTSSRHTLLPCLNHFTFQASPVLRNTPKKKKEKKKGAAVGVVTSRSSHHQLASLFP